MQAKNYSCRYPQIGLSVKIKRKLYFYNSSQYILFCREYPKLLIVLLITKVKFIIQIYAGRIFMKEEL